ncbi:ComEC/Rec2 family competence protein [Corallococcus macrosporus]|uniref:Metallo-beta-lactamase family protein n=1 Tax=Myxococcus fulvus (strain ATCC BAA-855 / HW-1) TaxID=483219 RepID=F8CNA9_MYXFH|nr:MBL fold metallo-hydrolase [Corallococcus macrosporus]AEI69093.1 metallo-beta-lactamase family protein [Corallococcus macrosporus]
MSPPSRIVLALLLALAACKEPPPPPPPVAARPVEQPRRYFGGTPDGKLHVYFFDVGQGDAALIVSPDGYTALVDAGPASSAEHLVNRLPELLTQRLDLVVLTHPHADHHGALEPVLKRVGARQLLEPQLGATPKAYDTLLGAVASQGVEFISPSPSPATPNALQRLPLGAGVSLTVLWPRAPTEPLLDVPEASLEANSVILRLTYGDTAVLFMADAHARTVDHLLERNAPMQATLLKVAAHGTDGPTSAAFLSAVGPRAAVVSSGEGNLNGAPAPATLERLEAAGAQVFRTDQHGEVQVVSDGKTLVVTPQRLLAGVPEDTRYRYPGLGAPTPRAPALAADPRRATGRPGTGSQPDGKMYTLSLDDPPADGPRSARPGSRSRGGASESGGVTVGTYVGSSRSDVFHKPTCRNVMRIKSSNLVTFATRAEAARGRRPARDCNP